jgi:hypothetical protein
LKTERLTDEGQSALEQMYSCKTIKEFKDNYDFTWIGQLDDFDDVFYILIHGFKMGLKYAKLKQRGNKR